MGFKELASLECNTTVALGGKDKKSGKTNPTSLEGYYIGSREVESAKSKTGFCKLHVFQTKAGDSVGLWGKTDSDRKLGRVKPGTMTRISFTGMQETKNNPMYVFKVEVDTSLTIDVGQAEATSLANESEGDTEYSNPSDDIDDTDEDAGYVEEPVLPRAAAPRQPVADPRASANKVRELLNRGKTPRTA